MVIDNTLELNQACTVKSGIKNGFEDSLLGLFPSLPGTQYWEEYWDLRSGLTGHIKWLGTLSTRSYKNSILSNSSMAGATLKAFAVTASYDLAYTVGDAVPIILAPLALAAGTIVGVGVAAYETAESVVKCVLDCDLS